MRTGHSLGDELLADLEAWLHSWLNMATVLRVVSACNWIYAVAKAVVMLLLAYYLWLEIRIDSVVLGSMQP